LKKPPTGRLQKPGSPKNQNAARKKQLKNLESPDPAWQRQAKRQRKKQTESNAFGQ